MIDEWGGVSVGGGFLIGAGMYRDNESKLLYNWNRYIEEPSGRYLTEDPVGLADGVNLYRHVGNNPLNRVDPYGTVMAAGTATCTFWAGTLGNLSAWASIDNRPYEYDDYGVGDNLRGRIAELSDRIRNCENWQEKLRLIEKRNAIEAILREHNRGLQQYARDYAASQSGNQSLVASSSTLLVYGAAATTCVVASLIPL